MKQALAILAFTFGAFIAGAQTQSRTDTLPSGELMLIQEILINQPAKMVWKAFTDPAHWKNWATPVVATDFRINGTIKTHYDPKASIGDKGTIILHIPFYIPERQIVMQAEIAEHFPEFMKGEEKNLHSVYLLEQLDDNTTRLLLYGIGYKNEKRWHDLLQFFIQGNEMTLNKLKKYLEQ